MSRSRHTSWTTCMFCFRNDLKPFDCFQKKSRACHFSSDFLWGHLLKCQERESISWSGTFRACWELKFCFLLRRYSGSQPPPCFTLLSLEDCAWQAGEGELRRSGPDACPSVRYRLSEWWLVIFSYSHPVEAFQRLFNI